MNRTPIKKEFLDISLKIIGAKTKYRLEQKGRGVYISTHEALGIVSEEYHELIEAVRSNKVLLVEKELLDIAVACHIGIACIAQAKED